MIDGMHGTLEIPATPVAVARPSADLNPPQREIDDQGLLRSGFSVVLQLPTGSGKTWLAEQAIAEVLDHGQRAIYLTPLRALANELLERWSTRFSGRRVGVFTGEFGQSQAYPVPFEQADLLIMTPERLDACTRHWRSHWGWLPEVALLVVDELHLLGDKGRGPRLEGALLRTRALNPFLRVLGLSATLGNRAELADWFEGVHYHSDWRQVPISWRSERFKRAADKPGILIAETQRCVDAGGQCLVFVQSRRRAEQLSALLSEASIPAGHHHAGLESSQRQKLEVEYRSGATRVLVSTGTLEMGLNLPARLVVLYDLQYFDGTDFKPLMVNTVWQRAGRAGRRGLDDRGEVLLIGAAWDREVDRYAEGRFERITSGLADRRALAEQMLAEVSSGLARTRSQLHRRFAQSLAAHQGRLPNIDHVLAEMTDSGMVTEVSDDDEKAPRLKATRLGRIAVRQMLAPATVLSLARAFAEEPAASLKFFDILLACAATEDCEPRIPADFEELEELGGKLATQPGVYLTRPMVELRQKLGHNGRRLLATLKTALIAREWTRTGCAQTVADDFGCYAFEVRRLAESLERILSAAVAIVTPPKKVDQTHAEEAPVAAPPVEEPVLAERVRALAAMVAHGVDEQTVTLTYVSGIGGTLARRLREAGIEDIEDLAQADSTDVAQIRGVSDSRATRWIEEAGQLMTTRSAFSLNEFGTSGRSTLSALDLPVDPYRLRRALDLTVRQQTGSYLVSGGLEPHRVESASAGLRCDCADFEKGHECKHVLAVRLSRNDLELLPVVARLSAESSTVDFDLIQLWFDREKP
jgi:helicase